MNHARLASLYAGLTGIAKKVAEAVPKNAPWTINEILGELRRTGANAEKRIVTGCLSTLVDIGLVREPTPGHFVRITAKTIAPSHPPQPPRERAAPEEKKMTPTEKPVAAAQVKPAGAPSRDPIETLTTIAVQLRSIGASANALAKQIDDAAVDVDDALQRKELELTKLRQLQDLLKSINQ